MSYFMIYVCSQCHMKFSTCVQKNLHLSFLVTCRSYIVLCFTTFAKHHYLLCFPYRVSYYLLYKTIRRVCEEKSTHLKSIDCWISKCFQLHLEWDMISTLPGRKRRADNESVEETLGIWSPHMDISVNGEQTDHNSAAFRQWLSNSWNPINANCFELQLLLNEVRKDKVMKWLRSKWFLNLSKYAMKPIKTTLPCQYSFHRLN